MKNNILRFACCSLVAIALNSLNISAQTISRQSIEDSVFGWNKLYHLKGAKESYKMDNHVYSTAQLSICDSFVNWIQASYVPIDALGIMLKKC